MPDPRYSKKQKKLSGEEEGRISKNNWERYKRARDNGHIDYVERAKRCDAFYRGIRGIKQILQL